MIGETHLTPHRAFLGLHVSATQRHQLLQRLAPQPQPKRCRTTSKKLVDAAAAPLFQRLAWCLELAPDLGVLEELPKVAAWSEALLARESVRKSTVSDIRERYFEYLQGTRGRNAEGTPSWLGRLAASGGLGR